MPKKTNPHYNKEAVKDGLKKFHSNPNKPTSAGSIKVPRSLSNARNKINDLIDPSVEIVKKAVTGDLVPEKRIWKGTPDELQEILNSDPSARIEKMILDNGLEVDVLVEYTSVPKHRVEIAKWVITQDIALKKAAEESKIRKLETALKEQKAKAEGVIPKEDPQKKAREFGGPKRIDTSYDPEWDSEEESDDDDEDYDN